jgi:phosphoglycolate phosphatase-like HAD superfamily hydrolase
MVLFFDLDGPLLDVSPRYVRLHHALLAQAGLAGMGADRYWERKRAACPEETILQELGAGEQAADYLRRRLELIESPEYLRHDRPWPWAQGSLARLGAVGPLVLVTARANRPLLLEQLDRLGLAAFFHEVLSAPAGRRVDVQKAELIGDYLARHGHAPRGHWMIGDTEADVGAGRLTGQRTVAVLSGIRNRALLLQASPDFLLDDIRALYSIVGPPPDAARGEKR